MRGRLVGPGCTNTALHALSRCHSRILAQMQASVTINLPRKRIASLLLVCGEPSVDSAHDRHDPCMHSAVQRYPGGDKPRMSFVVQEGATSHARTVARLRDKVPLLAQAAATTQSKTSAGPTRPLGLTDGISVTATRHEAYLPPILADLHRASLQTSFGSWTRLALRRRGKGG